MSELSSRARSLLAEARSLLAESGAGLEPDAARLARGRDRVLAATGASAIGTPAIAAPTAPLVPSTAATRASGLGASTLVGLGVTVLAVVIAAVLLVPRLRSSAGAEQGEAVTPERPSSAPAVAAIPAPERPAVPGDAIDLDDITLETLRPARTPRVAPSAPVVDPVVAPEAAPEPPDSLTRELAWLRAARAALRAGTPDAARVALAGYQREFAAGQLAEEAAALGVEAACAAGRPEVESLRAAFMRQWPTSTARARVERACR